MGECAQLLWKTSGADSEEPPNRGQVQALQDGTHDRLPYDQRNTLNLEMVRFSRTGNFLSGRKNIPPPINVVGKSEPRIHFVN